MFEIKIELNRQRHSATIWKPGIRVSDLEVTKDLSSCFWFTPKARKPKDIAAGHCMAVGFNSR